MSAEKDDSQAVTNAVLGVKMDRFLLTLGDHEDRIKSLERWRWGLMGAMLALLPDAIKSLAGLVIGTP